MTITGERVLALRAIAEHARNLVSLAYLDLPRLSTIPVMTEAMRLPIWLSVIRSTIETVAPLIVESGAIVVHIDDEGAAYTRLVLEQVLGPAACRETILWEKKYGPQNDLRGKMDDAYDHLFVCAPGGGPPEEEGGAVWWGWEDAGKSEDATREDKDLIARGIMRISEAPKTSKPRKLVNRLLERFTRLGDVTIELFGETAFFSAGAVAAGRVPILLAGNTEAELAAFEAAAEPRLQHEVGPGETVSRHHIELPIVARPARILPRDRPLRFAPGVRRQPAAAAVKTVAYRPLVIEGVVNAHEAYGIPSMRIVGDQTASFLALAPLTKATARLAFVDVRPLPARGVEREETLDGWLGELRDRVEAAVRVLDSDGVLALQAGTREVALARLLLDHSSMPGRHNCLGCIALPSRERGVAADAHEFMLLYRVGLQTWTTKIGLPVEREFQAKDGDPRGPWRDPGHKGARSGSESTARRYHVPPYRWAVVGGELPTGAWRLNPFSGAIWAERLQAAGRYRFTVRVQDARGQKATAQCEIRVVEEGTVSEPASVWWLDEDAIVPGPGAPRVETTSLPAGVAGQPYSTLLRASGGQPFEGTHAPGEPVEGGGWRRTRYWEFAPSTLEAAIREDRAIFGSKGTAKPRIKKYERPDHRDVVVELTWWDAKRLAGESAALRLLRIFTAENDLVVCASESLDELTSLAMDASRRCVTISPSSYCEGGAGIVARIGPPLAQRNPESGRLWLDYDAPSFASRLAALEGFLPLPAVRAARGVPPAAAERAAGVSPDARAACVVLAPDEWPTAGLCSDLAEHLSQHLGTIRVYYFRGTPPRGIAGLEFRRVPFELAFGH